jgi:hypothetical protein
MSTSTTPAALSPDRRPRRRLARRAAALAFVLGTATPTAAVVTVVSAHPAGAASCPSCSLYNHNEALVAA